MADPVTLAETRAWWARLQALASWHCLKCHTLKWRGFPCKACSFPAAVGEDAHDH